MLSAKGKRRVRHVVLLGVIVSFPLLYISAVTLASPVLTLTALIVTGVTAVLAALAF